MRRTPSARFVSSIAAVSVLAVIATACGTEKATDDSSGSVSTETISSAVETASPVVPGDDDVEATTGMVDEPGNPEISATGSGSTDEPAVSTHSTESDDSQAGPDVTGTGRTSDDIQDYIDSLAATTDDFDGLTTTPAETACAAAAVLNPIGVDLLQRQNVSVDDVDQELDLRSSPRRSQRSGSPTV